MGGFFGTIKKESCVTDLFYGVDYNSHLGTKRAGIVTYENGVFKRAIHNIENSYFRSKFEAELPEFSGNSGIGVISDTDAQPIIISCHLGKFAIVTVAKINNVEELEKELLASGNHFSEHSNNIINQSELVSMIISQGKDYVDGIRLVQEKIKGSCSMLLLTEQGIIAARDKYGRSPILVGRGDNGYAVSSETCSFPNLGYELCYDMRPGEIVRLTADGYESLNQPGKKMQICSFLWVYYGYPACEYEGKNVEEMPAFRFRGKAVVTHDAGGHDGKTELPGTLFGHGVRHVGLGVPHKSAVAAAGTFVSCARCLLHADSGLAGQRTHRSLPLGIVPRTAGILHVHRAGSVTGEGLVDDRIELRPQRCDRGLGKGFLQRRHAGGAGGEDFRPAARLPVAAEFFRMLVEKSLASGPVRGNAAAGAVERNAAGKFFAKEPVHGKHLTATRRRQLTAGEKHA